MTLFFASLRYENGSNPRYVVRLRTYLSRARKTTGLKNPFFSSVAWPLLTRFRQKGPSKCYVSWFKILMEWNNLLSFHYLDSMIKTFSRHFSCSRELGKQVKNFEHGTNLDNYSNRIPIALLKKRANCDGVKSKF